MTPLPRPNLESLSAKRYDLLVLGGGINGAGIARDAALRGLTVLLIEKNDFGFGASSRSTKLAHGGLRYLESAELGLVRESLKERAILQDVLAPHLVHPLPFLLPFYGGDLRPPWKIKLGLWLYDLLALGSSIRTHQSFGRVETLRQEPALERRGLKGAGLYWDCRMNDARLVLENIVDAEQLGAVCLNYTVLKSVEHLSTGDLRGRVLDLDTGQEVAVSARLLINTTGPWVDEALDSLGRAQGIPAVKPTKGVHLVTRSLTKGHALLVPARSDGRVFFIIPCDFLGEPASLIGTTDTDFHGDKAHVHADAADVAYLLAETRRVLPGADLRPADIKATYAGLRPLSAPHKDARGNFHISRESQILEQDGLLSVTGGKFTTYRALAEKVVDRAARLLGLKLGSLSTAHRPLPGAGQFPSPSYLESIYGALAPEILSLGGPDPSLLEPIAPGLPAILAQVAYAVRNEKARHLVDFYLRRTFLGLDLAPDHPGVEKVAAVMAKELGWDAAVMAKELEDLERTINGEYRNS